MQREGSSQGVAGRPNLLLQEHAHASVGVGAAKLAGTDEESTDEWRLKHGDAV